MVKTDPDGPTLGPVTEDRIILAVVIALTVIIVADIAGAVIVSTQENRSPLVLGDVAKVGAGALAGLAAGIAMAIKMRRP